MGESTNAQNFRRHNCIETQLTAGTDTKHMKKSCCGFLQGFCTKQSMCVHRTGLGSPPPQPESVYSMHCVALIFYAFMIPCICGLTQCHGSFFQEEEGCPSGVQLATIPCQKCVQLQRCSTPPESLLNQHRSRVHQLLCMHQQSGSHTIFWGNQIIFHR